MTFRELLEKYRAGQASEEERAMVEAELEKSEAIADYLAERVEDELGTAEAQAPAGEVRHIQKKMNRRLRRTAVWAACIVLAVLLGVRFVVEPVVSSFHYQPNAQTVGQSEQTDVTFDLTALYSLLVPGQTMTGATAEPKGFGRYTLTYETRDWLTGQTSQAVRTMAPDEYGSGAWIVPSMQRDAFDLLLMEAIAQDGCDLRESNMGQEKIDYLTQLPATSYVAAWAHFPEDLNPIKLAMLAQEYEAYEDILSFRWAAVRMAEENMIVGYPTQACPYLDAAPDEEKYPMFSYSQMFDTLKQRTFTPQSKVQYDGSVEKQHFESMLAYLADRPEAVEALAGPLLPNGYYDFAAMEDYVTENGVQIYGALVYAQPEALLKLWEDGVMDGISIQEVLSSRYSGSRDIRQ
ncbi:MAG TPA: anti-sigma factor C-terminal domain-containing protein [Candidatus Flavonifractor avistercoris]|nr:anti-sigma factor C-terminal domain-containing protein [Candidatus Flavonifractor avistercoris]